MDAIEVVNRHEFLRPDLLQELVVWRVPVPLRGSVHHFKYRLALVADGVCVLRYDNEAGKGDHRHFGPNEGTYVFSGVLPRSRISTGTWRGGSMTTVVIEIKSVEQSHREIVEMIERGDTDPVPRIGFVSYELFYKVLAPNRMAIIRTMTGAGPLSIRDVARRVERDFKGVHTDVTALLNNGLLQKTEDGRIVFPYDDIHFDFRLSSAA
jgi:predicted transcriptional regulator